MIKIRLLLISVTLLIFSGLSLNAQNNGDYFLHTIKKGENLSTIASMYNVSSQDIIKLNPGSDKVIYSGKTLMIPQTKVQNDNDIFYTIKSGDTLYRLSVNYQVSIDAIIEANPGLSAQNFKIGQVIRIPQSTQEDYNREVDKRSEELNVSNIQPEVKSRCREMHKVKKRETIYSVSRKYGISEDALIQTNPELKQGMKKGMYLCIPNEEVIKKVEVIENPYITETPPTDAEIFEKKKEVIAQKSMTTLSAAIVLPFGDNNKKAETYRMLEFYEGFLLAVDSLKQKGVSMDIYVFDSGETKNDMVRLLTKPELQKVDIIFGPLYQDQLEPLSNFVDKHDIRLVLPFTAKTDLVFSNPLIYQVNTPQSYLYNEVYQNFNKRFQSPNVIFIKPTTEDSSKAEYIDGFKADLTSKNIPYKIVSTDEDINSVVAKLDFNKKNIFIPMSGRQVALNEMLPLLNKVKELYPEVDFSLFGYPEWQTYTKDYIDIFFSLDTYFYSSFYTNNLLTSAKSFIKAYQSWYGKNMIDTYPKYGMLGFDIGYFFLYGLSKYGNSLENHIKEVDIVNSIQTGFNFDRVNNWGGLVNKKVFFVHFGKDYELSKIDFK